MPDMTIGVRATTLLGGVAAVLEPLYCTTHL
jgi:hypothetical protein